MHNREKPHKCAQCSKSFDYAKTLTEHTLSHSDQKPPKYIECKTTSNQVEKSHKCVQCNKLFGQAGTLRAHLLIHSGEKLHRCIQCNKSFTHAAHLKTHTLVHNKPHKCAQCSKSFNHAKTLTKHTLSHSDQKPPKYTESKTTSNKVEKSRNKSDDQADTLKTPLLTHNNSNQKSELVHLRETPHTCTQCNKSSKSFGLSSYYLKRHMLTHTKPHRCVECNKSFDQATKLRSHMLTHSGEKLHRCDQCNKPFGLSKDLKKHMQTHTKPHKCVECSRSFYQTTKLKSHMVTHSGAKDHKCGYCNHSFSSARHLMRHLLTHARDNQSQYISTSDVCDDAEVGSNHNNDVEKIINS